MDQVRLGVRQPEEGHPVGAKGLQSKDTTICHVPHFDTYLADGIRSWVTHDWVPLEVNQNGTPLDKSSLDSCWPIRNLPFSFHWATDSILPCKLRRAAVKK